MQLLPFIVSSCRQTLYYLTLFVTKFGPALDRPLAATGTGVVVVHFDAPFAMEL